ncbi:MAG: hypothetical protein KDI55_22350 [Anaerolineae bacterium]|nr:hypothetical protein [Anaerolineae bacterium]MCB0256470.1 hypothetical protein [Anaerolineae bacterium]
MTPTATRPPAVTSTPYATATAPTAITTSLERTKYQLTAALDYARHHLVVTQTITYTNSTGEILTMLPLVVEANRLPGVFELDELRWTDGQEIKGITLEGARMDVPLIQPLAPARTAAFSVFFRIALPARAAPLGYSTHQVNLGDWYPYVPPFQPNHGWLIHEPGLVGEHQVYDVSMYRVALRLVGQQTDLTVAASAPALIDGSWRRYYVDAARNFTLSLSPEYVMLHDNSGPVAVEAFVFPEHRAAGQAALQTTASALALYGRLFAPYPHASLSLVEADFADGMEFDGLYFLGREYFAAYDGTSRNYLTALAAHETAHQWWYGLVGNDQALEPWLDEALSTYSELLYYEADYPEHVNWWWNFRANRFQPTGWVNSTIYEHQTFRPYVDAVYLRGAKFLQSLRDRVGETEFRELLQMYAMRFSQGQAKAEYFFNILYALGASDDPTSEYFRR